MSARNRFAATAAVALTAAITGGTALLPSAAHAATPAGPLAMTVSTPAPSGPLVPGGAAETFTVTVTNNSATAQQFAPELGAGALGSLSVGANDVTFSALPLGSTPATGGYLGGQDGGLLGAFYPKGGQFGSAFTVPAHAAYSWRLSLAATKDWPVNDRGLDLGISANSGSVKGAELTFQVGAGGTGGPVVETLSGGSVLAPGQPLETTLTVTNKSGAPISQKWLDYISFGSDHKGGISDQVQLAADLWTGGTGAQGHWQALPSGELPPLPAGFANGASASFKLRVRVVSYSAAVPSGPVSMFVDGGIGYPVDGVIKELTVYRHGQTGTPSGTPTTSSSPTTSATVTATPSNAASTSASAATSAPASASASPTQLGGSLAHTGGGSDTGWLIGGALAFIGAGLALMVGLKRRAGQH